MAFTDDGQCQTHTPAVPGVGLGRLFFLVVDEQVAGVKVGQLERERAIPEFTFDIAVRQDPEQRLDRRLGAAVVFVDDGVGPR